MERLPLAPALALFLVGVVSAGAFAQAPPRERLGARFGYILSAGGLRDSYGDGGNLTLHFAEHLQSGLYFQFQLGAIGMGDLQRPELAPQVGAVGGKYAIFLVDGIETEMRILYITVGLQYTGNLSELWTGYGGVGAGIYSVSIPWTTGVESDVFSDQHLGGNATIGAMFRFTRTLNLDVGATLHYFHNSASPFDLYYGFTAGDTNPLFGEIALGLVLDLR
ncbi:MAG: hypothetical protein OEO21_03615 [Candidatus Krumholzibacteria bacterium]|nr:hypothetical protein [Candidatus Krumholzibacteria bacterium]